MSKNYKVDLNYPKIAINVVSSFVGIQLEIHLKNTSFMD